MRKLPGRQVLHEIVAETLLSMAIAETRDYDTTNRNYTTWRQTYYNVIKELDGEWLTKLNRSENILTIVRLK